MHIQYAAHVDHDISHSSDVGRVSLGIAGALIGIALVIGTGGGAIAVIGAIGMGGSLGMDVGGIVDNFMKPAVAGKIKTGFEPVVLGTQQKPAARANPDTIAGCHDPQPVAEGSILVMLGTEQAPMSRRLDRTECDGIIVDGLTTLLVGGDPSRKGETWDEQDSALVEAMGIGFTLASLTKSVAEKAFVDIAVTAVGTALDETGHGDEANVLRTFAALRSTPGSFLEGADQVSTAIKGVGSTNTLLTPE